MKAFWGLDRMAYTRRVWFLNPLPSDTSMAGQDASGWGVSQTQPKKEETMIRNCFALSILAVMCLALAGCGTDPKESLMGPPQIQGGADGTVIKARYEPMQGPLQEGQVRPMIKVGDPDADESRVGDPTSDD